MIGAYGRIVKRDSSGTFRWLLCFGGSDWEIPGSIEQTTDGNYILGGISFSTDGDVVGNHGGSYDLWVVKHGEGVPVDPPQLVVDARDSASSVLIPGAVVGLYDSAHSEWQNVTADTGSYTFQGSGSSHQYPLVPGTKYQLAASAAGYSPAVRDVIFTGDGQRETVELAKVEPEVYTYSMTNMEFYRQTHENLAVPAVNYYPGTGIYSNISRLLDREGWQLAFYHNDTTVVKEDFGTLGGGLNNATFHYHFGHGNYSQALIFYEYQFETDGTTPKPEQPYLKYSIHYSELDKKNKWVLIDACSVLENENWGRALKTSHGILGFASTKKPSQDLPNLFFKYALEENKTIFKAYQNATYGSFTKNVTAAVIFDNQYQLEHDHFPGHGEVAPDENPDDDYVIYPEPWNCGGGKIEN